jgi:hypothetical protein
MDHARVRDAIRFGVFFVEFRRKVADVRREAKIDLEHAKEIADIRREAGEHHANLSGQIQMAALLQNPDFRELRGLTQTTEAPVVRTIAVANTEIAELRTELASLRWRTLTPEQRKRFGDAIPKDRTRLQLWRVFCVPIDAEAQSYAKQLLYLFWESGIYLSDPDYYNSDAGLSRFDKYGCAILVKEINLVDAQILKSAFDSAGIDCTITSEGFASNANDNFLAVRVGPKPK